MRRLILLMLVLWAATAWADSSLEVFKLRYKTADEVIPTLTPLVEPGGAITGQLNSVFVRASRANREAIREALAALDVPTRRVLISVRQDNRSAAELNAAGVGIRAGRGGVEVRGGAWSTRGDASDRASQQVQTVDGGRALISVGTSLPLPMREVAVGPYGAVVSERTVYRDVGTGFVAVPVLAGERVNVEISPQQESIDAGGTVRGARLVTRVSGRVGEWIELGGSGVESERVSGGGFGYSTRGESSQRRVLLKVDVLQ